MAKVINCACGETIRGETDSEVLDNAEEHVREGTPTWPTNFRARPSQGWSRTTDRCGRGRIRRARDIRPAR